MAIEKKNLGCRNIQKNIGKGIFPNIFSFEAEKL
jgi:hypothetical protein